MPIPSLDRAPKVFILTLLVAAGALHGVSLELDPPARAASSA